MKVALLTIVIGLLTIHSAMTQDWADPITRPPTSATKSTTAHSPSSPTTQSPTRPTTHQPTTNRPTTHQPTTNRPTTHQPTTNRPTTHQPTTNRPTTHRPTTHRPTTHRPTTHRPPVDCDVPPNEKNEAILLPNPRDCGSYYVCDGMNPILMPCPKGLEFNDELKVCDWPQSANCTIKAY